MVTSKQLLHAVSYLNAQQICNCHACHHMGARLPLHPNTALLNCYLARIPTAPVKEKQHGICCEIVPMSNKKG